MCALDHLATKDLIDNHKICVKVKLKVLITLNFAQTLSDITGYDGKHYCPDLSMFPDLIYFGWT